MPDPILCQEKINESLLLSAREKEVAGMLALGWQRKKIADSLGISVRTLEHHCARIYKKLGLKGHDSKTALILLAFKRGWVKAAGAEVTEENIC